MEKQYFCIFKIFTLPKKELPPIATAELSKKKKSTFNSEIPSSILKSLNPHMSDIKFVYRCVVAKVSDGNTTTVEVQEGTEKVQTFLDFMEWAYKHGHKFTWVGWNCNVFDIPFLNIESIKVGVTYSGLNIFQGRKYYKTPVFDMQDFLYNFSYPSSLALTAEGFGYNAPSTFYDLEKIYENANNTDNSEELQYVLEQGKMILNVFLKVYHLYF